MKNLFKVLLLCICISLSCMTYSTQATPIVINPVDDGSIYSSGSVSTGAYLMASGYIRAVAEFSTSEITDPISQALLSVNPYGLPLWGATVQVFAYESCDGMLTSSDYDAGVFLGDWVLPGDLSYGEDAYFDVTGFMMEITSPYVGFNLRTGMGGTDVFSSLEYNYGHPAQLMVTSAPVPEPATIFLFGIGFTVLAGCRLKKRRQ